MDILGLVQSAIIVAVVFTPLALNAFHRYHMAEAAEETGCFGYAVLLAVGAAITALWTPVLEEQCLLYRNHQTRTVCPEFYEPSLFGPSLGSWCALNLIGQLTHASSPTYVPATIETGKEAGCHNRFGMSMFNTTGLISVPAALYSPSGFGLQSDRRIDLTAELISLVVSFLIVPRLPKESPKHGEKQSA